MAAEDREQTTDTLTIKTSLADSVVRAMLKLEAATAARDTKVLKGLIDQKNVSSAINGLFLKERMSNKELWSYLRLLLETITHPGDKTNEISISKQALVKLRFPTQDKYLANVIYTYFLIMDRIYTLMAPEDREILYQRYIYLFENEMAKDLALFPLFKRVLKADFLGLFIAKKHYTTFPYLREFVFEFPVQSIQIGYEKKEFQDLIFQLNKNRGVEYDWIVQQWNVNYHQLVSSVFYRFDCRKYMGNLAKRKIMRVRDLAGLINNEMKGNSACSNTQFHGIDPSRFNDGKKEVLEFVERFNRNPEDVSREEFKKHLSYIRLLPAVSLKTLGAFLCKECNGELFLEYTETFSFANMDLLTALRVFLRNFAMPGESQIVDRVVKTFSEVFCRQNGLTEPIFGFVYSIIWLNTMLHNPSVDKKPTVEEYMRMVGDKSANPDLVREYYGDIKSHKIEYPTEWKDSYDLHLLYLKIIEMEGANVEEYALCNDCVIKAFKALFSACYDSYLFLNPRNFLEICKMLGEVELYRKYMREIAGNNDKRLVACIYLMEEFFMDEDDAVEVIGTLEKVYKPKASMVNDIKSLFISSKPEETSYEILPAHSTLVDEFLGLKFSSGEICMRNLKLLGKRIEGRGDQHILWAFVLKIIANNIETVDDISFVPDKLAIELARQRPESIKLLNDEQKTVYLSEKEVLDDGDYEEFCRFKSETPRAFELHLRFLKNGRRLFGIIKIAPPSPETGGQEQPDDAMKINGSIRIARVEADRNIRAAVDGCLCGTRHAFDAMNSGGIIAIYERYPALLSEPENVVRLVNAALDGDYERILWLDDELSISPYLLFYLHAKAIDVKNNGNLVSLCKQLYLVAGSDMRALINMLVAVLPLIKEMSESLRKFISTLYLKGLKSYAKSTAKDVVLQDLVEAFTNVMIKEQMIPESSALNSAPEIIEL